jgi:diketogulonate reductase-like aldo/keto reductase
MCTPLHPHSHSLPLPAIHTPPQVEAHPYWRNTPLLDWAASKGIHVTAYSPLGSPDSADALRRELDMSPLKDPVVLQVAQRVGKDAGQVRWRHL